MSDPTRIKELRKEIESLCGNCDRPDKEQLGEIIISSMALGFSYGMEADRPQGWVDKAISIIDDMQREGIIDYEQAWEFRMRARMEGAVDDI